jgi:hypothetical protein
MNLFTCNNQNENENHPFTIIVFVTHVSSFIYVSSFTIIDYEYAVMAKRKRFPYLLRSTNSSPQAPPQGSTSTNSLPQAPPQGST